MGGLDDAEYLPAHGKMLAHEKPPGMLRRLWQRLTGR